MAERTFSFIARSATDTERAAVFTLRGDRLSIAPAGALEYLERHLESDQEEGSDQGAAMPWLKPAVARLLQHLQPFDVRDVMAEASGEHLTVRTWVRGAGLRLAPLTFTWEDVDNPDAAAGFVRELERRRRARGERRRLPGPLDYWGFWGLLGALTGIAVQFAIRKDNDKH